MLVGKRIVLVQKCRYVSSFCTFFFQESKENDRRAGKRIYKRMIANKKSFLNVLYIDQAFWQKLGEGKTGKKFKKCAKNARIV